MLFLKIFFLNYGTLTTRVVRDVISNKKEVVKGTRGMPWLSEAKKDVISCDKLRGLANTGRSADFRMGQPTLG
jgi:hypothetical protein